MKKPHRLRLSAIATILSLLSTSQLCAYTAHDGKMYDGLGNVIDINGVNWSGFQDSGFIDELYGSVPFYPLGTSAPFGLVDMLTHPWDNAGTGVTKSDISIVSNGTVSLDICKRWGLQNF